MKRRIFCPECGHGHTVEINVPIKAIGVRRNNKYEYSVIAPNTLDDNNEYRLLSTKDQVTLVICVSTVASATACYTAYQIGLIPLNQVISVNLASWGTFSFVGLLWQLDEIKLRLKRVTPAFLKVIKNHKLQLPISDSHNEVNLTVDHRYRDGNTESGRTVEYFGKLPVNLDKFNEYAQSVLLGETLAINYWTGSGKLFSRNEYDNLLLIFQNCGTVTNLGSNKGNVLTGHGKRALKQHLKQNNLLPPSPAT